MYKSILSCIDECEKAGVPIAVVHISSGFNPPPMTKLGKTRFKNIVEYAIKNDCKKLLFISTNCSKVSPFL